MRLAQIKLAGFKSFVDPTVVPVSCDLVGIVGPNGCGKSNVIDAIRWVLGESKAAALRGDSMQDVIFAGSDHRRAMGRASVEIVFDNHANKVTGQWSSYAEISIKRVLQRDSGSAYYINNLQVRRRDITDLFLGTGAGSRGYAIVEQGMISQIIEARPQELRNFLEEAAGISQYRERKQETSLRLADTRKNLIRLEDIHQELSVQLKHLEAQAAVAQQYNSLQRQLQNSQALSWLKRQIDAMQQLEQIKQEITQHDEELVQVIANQHDAEKCYEELRAREYLINDQLLQIQGQLYTTDAEIGRLTQEIQHIRATKQRLYQQVQQIEVQLQKNDRLKANSSEQLVSWQSKKAELELKYQEKRQEHAVQNKQLPIVEAEFMRLQKKLDECRHDLLIVEQENQLANNHIAHVTKNITQLEARKARLSKEQGELFFPDSEKLIGLQNEIDEMTATLQREDQSRQQLKQQITEVSKQKHIIVEDLQTLRQESIELKARQAALQDLQQRLENNQHLIKWLSNKRWNELPRLWQGIQITPHWEIALEAVLRERLNGIQFERLEQILDEIDELPSAKWVAVDWGLFPRTENVLRSDTTNRIHDHEKLLDRVTVHHAGIQRLLEDWLWGAYITETFEHAILHRHVLGVGEMLVTPQGHIVTRQGCAFYAPDSQLHGVLSRRQELIKIDSEIEKLDLHITERHGDLTEIEQQYLQLEIESRRIQEHSGHLQQQVHNFQLEAVRLTQISDRTIHRNQQITAELMEIAHALESEIALREMTIENISRNLERIDMLESGMQLAQQDWEAANTSLVKYHQLIQQIMNEIQEVSFQLSDCQARISEINSNTQRIDSELQELAADHNRFQEEMAGLDDAPLSISLEAAHKRHEATEQTMRQVRQEVSDTADRLREMEERRMAAERRSSVLRDGLNQLQLKAQAITITMNQLEELLQQIDIDKESLQSKVMHKSATALQHEIAKLNREISELGSTNLAAIDELENVRLRESDLLIQLNDLNAAISTLETVIRQIDKETQERLRDTFMQVNAHLAEIFPVIFAGGQARLSFAADDVIDEGFILTAQPPGKKNSSIQLLSGGEKALTALALVFSLFRLNPAPFCLLDEVDAPLDDSNTGRFCDLVKQMAKHTQFLFISHNKITMEMAHRLVGVTMQEQGVSRVVTVDLADAIKMGKREKESIV